MATANFTIDPEDGWTAVTSAGVNFIAIRSNTPNHAFYVTSAASLPAATVVGYKVQCHEFKVNVPTTDNYYVRSAENQPRGTRIDVFYIAT